MTMDESVELILVNVAYWSFIGLVALHITPWILAVLLLLPGFSSSPKVEVECGGTTVRMSGRDVMDRRTIRRLIKEAQND